MKKKKAPPRKSNKKLYYFFYFLKITILTVIYYVTARFGLSLDAVNNFATLIWLPSGIAVSVLILFGRNLWPGIAVGAFFANFLNGAPFPVALSIGAGNTFEALACVYLLRRKNFKNSFNNLRDVYLFVLTAVPISAGISATIGVTSLLADGIISLSSYYITWISWIMGDLISMLIVTPFIVTWKSLPHFKISIRRVIEIVVLTALVFIVVLAVFFPTRANYPITYLVFLPLIWAAFRFGQHGSTAVVLILSTMAIIGTLMKITPFSTGNLTNDLLSVQSFMGIISGTSLILAAVVLERQELEKRKDEFLAMASHELKTPVTSMKLYIQLLHRKFRKLKDTKSADAISKIDGQVDKLINLINDLLDVTKIEEGKLQFNFQEVDLNDLVAETVSDMQLATRHKIEKKLMPLPHVNADRDRIGQVLANIISNAIKYSPASDRIIVKTALHSANIIVSVKDFGVGLSKNDQKKVFERFNRAGQDRKGGLPGLGLGLYISKEIIKRHKGQVWLKSTKGRGTTFYFSLPILLQ